MDHPQKNKASLSISILTLAAGAVVMTGWLFNVPAFESIVPGFEAMRFNAALCFALFASALLLSQFKPTNYNRLAFFIIALLGTGIGLTTLLQDLFNFKTGLDQLFVTDSTIPSYSIPYPGRMAFNASTNFFLLGIGFLTLNAKKRRWVLFSQVNFHLVTILSAIALIGYLYGVSFFRVFLYKTSMATHTALLFFFLSVGASLLNPTIGIIRLFTGKRVGDQMGRRLFGLMFLMVVIFGSLRMQTQRFGLFSSVDVGISILAVGFLMVSLLLIWNAANWLNNIDKKRSEAESEVRRMNAGLEKMVEERSVEFQRSEEKYRSLIEQASDAIYVIDNKGNFTDVNASMCTMMDYGREELLQMNVESIIEQEELKTEPLAKQMGAIKEAVIRERKFMRKNGAVFPVEINVKKFADDRIMVIARDITGRKKMEAELKDAEIKFRTVADKSMVGVYIAQNGKFIYVNPRFAGIFGYEPAELINTVTIETIFHESFKAIALENVRKRIAGEVESIHYEAMGKKKDGASNWVEFYGSRAIIGGQPTIIGSMIDITERKQAEEELRSSEQKYKLLFESNPSPLWMISKDEFTVIDVNEAAARLYGYSKKELLNRRISMFRPPEDLEKQREHYNQNAETVAVQRIIKHVKKDGSLMFVEVISNDIIFEGRRVRLSLTNDVTEKLKAEESLKKSEANLQTILKTTDTAYVLCDMELNFLAFNPKAEEFVKEQYHHTPNKGDKLTDYFPGIKFPKFVEYTRDVLNGKTFAYEIDYPQADGSVYWYYVKLVPITNDNKEILGLMLAFYDITERKNAEQDLKNAYKRIQDHIGSIKDMAWKQSHLIRSPLANLKGLAAILKEDPTEPTVFEHIEKELNRMDAILIEMAKDASGHEAND